MSGELLIDNIKTIAIQEVQVFLQQVAYPIALVDIIMFRQVNIFIASADNIRRD